MKYTTLFFLLYICLLSPLLSAQTSEMDSLKSALNSLDDQEKASVYNRIFVLSGPYILNDSALYFAEQAKFFAEKYRDDLNLGFAYRNIGFYYDSKSQYEKSIPNYLLALDYIKKSDHIKRTITTYHELTNVLISNSDFYRAAEVLFEALKLSEDNDYIPGIIKINHALGGLYRQLEKYEEAESYLEKALHLEEQQVEPEAGILTQIVKTLGLVKYAKKEYDKAIEYYERGLKYQEKIGDDREMMMLNNSIALVYSALDKKNLALDYYKKAYDYALQSETVDLITAALLNIGREYLMMGEYKRAIAETNKGLKLANEYNLVKWQRNGYNYLYNCYNYLDDAANALINYQKYRRYDDSLKIKSTQFKIAELETKYETEKKERQIELLNNKNEISALKLKQNRLVLYALIAFTVLILTMSLVFFRSNRLKQKSEAIIKKQELEKKLLSTVIDTEDKERKRFAADLHDSLGPILSSIKLYLSGLSGADEKEQIEMLTYSRELIDESIKSVRTISNNILPVELSEKGLIPSINDFCHKLHLSETIEVKMEDKTALKRFEKSTEVILYRVVQELINNTIKHSGANKITIQFSMEGSNLLINYRDNGKGFDFHKMMNSSHEGLGLKNLQARVTSLQGKIEFINGPEIGMEIRLAIPTTKNE